MTHSRRGFVLLAALVCWALFWMGSLDRAGALESRSGHITWNSWELSWEITGNRGLELRQVLFDGHPFLHEASMPVIRVKYVTQRPWWHPYSWWPLNTLEVSWRGGRCGPFQHRISWDRNRPLSECSNRKVCIDSYFSGGVEWLELGVFAEIGEHEIYQTWYLSDNGQLNASVQSGGLSCHSDHVHHTYWRFSFARTEQGRYQVFVNDEGKADAGWGPGWRKYTREVDTDRNLETQRKWLVRNHLTGDGVWILPGPDDGKSDTFSDRDVSVRAFKESEDEAWIFGARGELGYNNGENLQETDIVFWYIAHLQHRAKDGAYPRQGLVGPTLRMLSSFTRPSVVSQTDSQVTRP